MRSILLLLTLAIMPQLGTTGASVASAQTTATEEGPNYTADHQLKMPENYREWIFLTSGVDMSYNPSAAMAGHSMFDNVFVNPTAYKAFLKTGAWPDKTTFALEIRGAEGPSSINKRGHSQSQDIMGMEVHVKDSTLEGGWGFFEFDGPGSAKLIARPASCYTCHESHGAVDTTFVQFYPTLLGLAKAKGTLNAAYLKEISVPASTK
jgi:hypothetical protein